MLTTTLQAPSSSLSVVGLDLFGAPTGIRIAACRQLCRPQMFWPVADIPHVGRGLDGGNKLQSRIGHTNDADNGTGHNAEPALAYDNRANEDVEDAAAEEREHERGIARHLLGDLELKESRSCGSR